MAVLDQELGQLSGNIQADLTRIASYLAYLREQMEFNDANIKRRLSALEKGE